MAQVYAFQPPPAPNLFQFNPTLDGDVYAGVVRWGLFGQRWYLFLSDLNGDLVVTLPLIASPNDYDISLVAGYFTDKLIFREASQQFEVP